MILAYSGPYVGPSPDVTIPFLIFVAALVAFGLLMRRTRA
jgi:ribose/xylose/arabinose/galactoside ABC-type transport system permease subunit